jgi:hypothetical protein
VVLHIGGIRARDHQREIVETVERLRRVLHSLKGDHAINKRN